MIILNQYSITDHVFAYHTNLQVGTNVVNTYRRRKSGSVEQLTQNLNKTKTKLQKKTVIIKMVNQICLKKERTLPSTTKTETSELKPV